MCLYSHSTQYSSKYSSNIKNSFNSEAHALNTISQQLHHMEGACCLHDTGVQKLTLNMLCPFLTSPGEGRPQHYITTERDIRTLLLLQIDYHYIYILLHFNKFEISQAFQTKQIPIWKFLLKNWEIICNRHYRSGTVNSKSFVGKVLLLIKRKFELTYAL